MAAPSDGGLQESDGPGSIMAQRSGRGLPYRLRCGAADPHRRLRPRSDPGGPAARPRCRTRHPASRSARPERADRPGNACLLRDHRLHASSPRPPLLGASPSSSSARCRWPTGPAGSTRSRSRSGGSGRSPLIAVGIAIIVSRTRLAVLGVVFAGVVAGGIAGAAVTYGGLAFGFATAHRAGSRTRDRPRHLRGAGPGGARFPLRIRRGGARRRGHVGSSMPPIGSGADRGEHARPPGGTEHPKAPAARSGASPCLPRRGSSTSR